MNLKALLAELRAYPGGVREELGKVQWPTRHRTLRLSMIVVGAVSACTLIVSAMDAVFSQLISLLVRA